MTSQPFNPFVCIEKLLRALSGNDFHLVSMIEKSTGVAGQSAKKGAGNYAPNYFLRVFKAFMTYCNDFHDINMVNPCKGINPLAVELSDKYISSDQDIELVKANCNAGQRLLIDIVWQTGARINEIMNLRAEHIDWQNNRMTLFTKKSRNANRTYRKIKIPQCLTEASMEIEPDL